MPATIKLDSKAPSLEAEIVACKLAVQCVIRFEFYYNPVISQPNSDLPISALPGKPNLGESLYDDRANFDSLLATCYDITSPIFEESPSNGASSNIFVENGSF
jgi:hypothetical protein